MKEGRKGGRDGGRKGRRKGGREEGRKEGRKEGREGGREGRKGGRPNLTKSCTCPIKWVMYIVQGSVVAGPERYESGRRVPNQLALYVPDTKRKDV